LQEQANALLQRCLALQQTMREIVAGEAGHVRLGAIEPTASMRLAPLLVSFCQEYPKLQLTLEVGSAPMMIERVASCELDFALCSPPESQTELTFEPLFLEELRVLLPERHPLASKVLLNPADLLDQRLLLTERGCSYRAIIEKALLSQGTNPFSGIEMGSVEVIKRAVQGGLGIAIIPVAAAAPPPSQTLLRKLHGVDLCLPVGLVSHYDARVSGRAQQALFTFLQTHLKKGNTREEFAGFQEHTGIPPQS
jgi:DNA-binding transcriptional LysR family regulator